MKRISILILALLFLISCNKSNHRDKNENLSTVEYQQISNLEYDLYKPKGKPSAVLVLFGGYPEVADDIKREFKVLEKAKSNNIAVVFSNYNQKLWFEENELKKLAEQLQQIFTDHKLPNNNVHFGGFSSGGNVALLIGNFLTVNEEFGLGPKGIFVVDSPIDLVALYNSAQKNINRNFSEVSVQEGHFIVEKLGNELGSPIKDLKKYEKHSVFTSITENIENIKNLKNTKIRMYSEPDTLWWKENRMADYEQLNAFYLKKLAKKLIHENFSKVEYITTENRGYRSNGEKHPHSWSIVQPNDLIDWVLNE